MIAQSNKPVTSTPLTTSLVGMDLSVSWFISPSVPTTAPREYRRTEPTRAKVSACRWKAILQRQCSDHRGCQDGPGSDVSIGVLKRDTIGLAFLVASIFVLALLYVGAAVAGLTLLV